MGDSCVGSVGSAHGDESGDKSKPEPEGSHACFIKGRFEFEVVLNANASAFP